MSSYNDKILTQELTEHRNDGEFDWEELELRLGEFHQANGSVTAEESKRLAFALSIILDWLICENLTRKHGLRTIGKRAVSMAWVLNPKRFGEDASLHSLAKELGFKAANISPLTAEFSRLFSVFNKYQNHDWPRHC